MSTIPAQDTRDKHLGIRGAPEDLADVTARAATLGLSGPVWARNTLLDALETATGYRDTARRKATRRPNRKPREDRQGNPPALMLRVSAAEHQHITDLARGLGMTITEWAWGVLTEALEADEDSKNTSKERQP